jgi:hypothetical protein
MLLDTVHGDRVCRRLMTAPVDALTYRATIDQPPQSGTRERPLSARSKR